MVEDMSDITTVSCNTARDSPSFIIEQIDRPEIVQAFASQAGQTKENDPGPLSAYLSIVYIRLTVTQTNSRPINHIAVSVPDIEAATRWYADNLGFELIGNQIKHVKRSITPSAPIFGIYGESLNEVKLAYMTTANGVGFELFEFVDPAFKKNDMSFEYNRSGFFHICVTDKQPDALAEKLVAVGGRRVGTTQSIDGGVCCLYVQDPWGNVVEILDTSFDRLATMATAS